MSKTEYLKLKEGDLVTPKGKALDRDKVFKVLYTKGNDIYCEITEGTITMPNNFDGLNMCLTETVRRYKYHTMQKI